MKNLTKTFGIFISIIGLLTTTCDNGNSIHSHEWSDWTLQSGATCTSAEVQERSCSCGEIQTQNFGNPVHFPTAVIPCKFQTCTKCNEITQDAVHNYTNGICTACFSIEMIKIPAGTFKMGSHTDELNRHQNETRREANDGNVALSSFYMAKYTVTQGLWKNVMNGATPSYFIGDNLPVEQVSWYDAVEFCNALSAKQGLMAYYTINKTVNSDLNNLSVTDTLKWLVTTNETANGYRLPTEAQWEYACRAGTETAYNWGTNEINTTQANYDNKSKTTMPVNTFTSNAWGLYNMHGNVYELCWDWLTQSYNDAGGSDNPRGPVAGANRVVRGGSWIIDGYCLRSAFRSSNVTPSGTSRTTGFRLVRP